MSYFRPTQVREYLGSSTDTKPTSDVPKGSIFKELDSKLEYIFDGTQWLSVKHIPVHKNDRQTTGKASVILWTPTSGKKFVITDIVISVEKAGTFTVKDGSAIIDEYYFADNGGCVKNLTFPYISEKVNNTLNYSSLGMAGKTSISVDGYEVKN